MNFSHFFIRRPIFAAVLSIVIVILGVVALVKLPVAQYPEVAPPTIDRTALGERVTRFYAQNGQRFTVVLQPLAADGEVRVAAIYLPAAR